MNRRAAALILSLPVFCVPIHAGEYESRVAQVTRTPGFVALWDFVKTKDGRFDSHQRRGDVRDFSLDAVNYVLDFWGEGRAATYADFPLLGRGPFGQAIQIRAEPDPSFRPVLLVPRARLHNSRLDVKGPGKSVSMLAWVVRTSGNHAIAGIWHEGTDLKMESGPAARVESGRRQYALFAGLAANNGASAVHVSENGASSFGDRYARNLAVTPEVIPQISPAASADEIDAAWTVAGFTFDNARNTVTAYLNGKATEYWIDEPLNHPFYQWPARAWQQPGSSYIPPERKPLRTTVLAETSDERTELRSYPFTKVRVTLAKDAKGRFTVVRKRELASLRVNPFWFPHDLYAPARAEEGGPFTIGRVIHSSRGVGFTGWIGAVAVFDRPLSPAEMRRLSAIGRDKGPLRLP